MGHNWKRWSGIPTPYATGPILPGKTIIFDNDAIRNARGTTYIFAARGNPLPHPDQSNPDGVYWKNPPGQCDQDVDIREIGWFQKQQVYDANSFTAPVKRWRICPDEKLANTSSGMQPCSASAATAMETAIDAITIGRKGGITARTAGAPFYHFPAVMAKGPFYHFSATIHAPRTAGGPFYTTSACHHFITFPNQNEYSHQPLYS